MDIKHEKILFVNTNRIDDIVDDTDEFYHIDATYISNLIASGTWSTMKNIDRFTYGIMKPLFVNLLVIPNQSSNPQFLLFHERESGNTVQISMPLVPTDSSLCDYIPFLSDSKQMTSTEVEDYLFTLLNVRCSDIFNGTVYTVDSSPYEGINRKLNHVLYDDVFWYTKDPYVDENRINATKSTPIDFWISYNPDVLTSPIRIYSVVTVPMFGVSASPITDDYELISKSSLRHMNFPKTVTALKPFSNGQFPNSQSPEEKYEFERLIHFIKQLSYTKPKRI